MKTCRLHLASFCQLPFVAGLLSVLLLGSIATGQTIASPARVAQAKSAPAEKSPARAPAKSVGELPPPEPAGEAVPVTPGRNPFPTQGLGLPTTPLKEGQAPNIDGDVKQQPGYFGAITDDRQKLPGVRIVEVMADGPAEKGGLLAGDLITAVNDQPVREMADLAKIFTSSHAGQKLNIAYQRGATLNTPGRDATLIVTLGERPAEQARRYTQFGRIDEDAVPQNEGDRPSGMILGVRTAPLDLANQRRLGVPTASGALVLDVTPGSPAALASIPRDAVIVSLNGLLIDSPDALMREILNAGPGAEVELGYYVGRNPIRRRIVLGGGQHASAPLHGGPFGGNPPGPNHPSDAAAARITQLEQQVQELQRRIEVLEQQLQK